MTRYIQSPGFKEAWDDIGPGFSEDFARWINDLLDDRRTMNLNDLANIGQVIGAIAVVISLIYVAYRSGKTPTLCALLPLNPCTNILQAGTICLPPTITLAGRNRRIEGLRVVV